MKDKKNALGIFVLFSLFLFLGCNRSQAAYRKLKEKGYANLYVLFGGMVEYAKK